MPRVKKETYLGKQIVFFLYMCIEMTDFCVVGDLDEIEGCPVWQTF